MNYIEIFSLGGFIIILAFYETLSHRKKSKLPRVPLGLLLLYCILRMIGMIYVKAGMPSTAVSINVASTIAFWMAIIRIIVFFVLDFFLRQKKGMVIPTITRDFGLAIAYLITAMIILKHNTTINLGSILTTSAILTAVIGFAMQDTLGNLFSGLALQLEHPYEIGDWIGFDGLEGKVVGITWKSTRILTRNEELVMVPNNTISKSTLMNFSRPTPRHLVSFEIGVSYDDPPHKVRKAIIETTLNNSRVLKSFEPSVFLTRYDNFSVLYKCQFATEDFSNENRTKFEILNDLWYRFNRDGIKIPYPVQESIQKLPERKEEKRLIDEAAIIEALSSVSLFSSLPPEAKKELAKNISVYEYAENEEIVTQGDEPGPMYIIAKGKCKVVISHDGSDPSVVAVLKEMDFFGEMCVLTGAPRTASVRALTNTKCYEIEKSDIKDLLAKYPNVPKKMTEILVQRQAYLNKHKTQIEESVASKVEQEGQLLSKIKSFLGI